MKSEELVTRQVRAMRRYENRQITKLAKVVEQGLWHATLIDDHGAPVDPVHPVSLTPQQMRVAQDMRRERRDCPVYLEFALRRIESIEKANADNGPKIALNIGSVVRVEAAAYPRLAIDAEVKE